MMMSSFIPLDEALPFKFHSLFHPLYQKRQREGKNQVKKGHGPQTLPGSEGTSPVQLAHMCKLAYRQDRDQEGVLQHGDEIIPQWGQNHADGLWQDDIAHSLEMAHPKRAGCLHLSSLNRFNPCAKDLRFESTVCDRQARDRPVNHIYLPDLNPGETIA